MIHALHGSVGSFLDWSLLKGELDLVGESITAHDLWLYCQNNGCDLWQFAALFNEAVTKGSEGLSHDLIGYSMGGRLALHALLQNQSLWRSAVIVSAHTGLQNSSLRSERLESDLQWANLAADQNCSWLSFLEQWSSQTVLRSGSESPILEWHDRTSLAAHRDQIAESFRNWSLARQDDLLERLSEVKVPILWVVGARDEKFRAIAQEAVLALPHGELLTIPDAGHRVPWEAPDDFHSSLLQWLKRHR